MKKRIRAFEAERWDERCRSLLRAIKAGKITGGRSAGAVLGISTPTFARWVRECRRRGVVFKTNPAGGISGNKPWRIVKMGGMRL